MKPEKITIVGIPYKIKYFDNPSDVDINKRTAYWGLIDFWPNEIRVYNPPEQCTEQTTRIFLHEVLHGIAEHMKIKSLQDDKNHDDLDMIATGLNQVLRENQDLLKMFLKED